LSGLVDVSEDLEIMERMTRVLQGASVSKRDFDETFFEACNFILPLVEELDDDTTYPTLWRLAACPQTEAHFAILSWSTNVWDHTVRDFVTACGFGEVDGVFAELGYQGWAALHAAAFQLGNHREGTEGCSSRPKVISSWASLVTGLIRCGADVHCVNPDGYTPLMCYLGAYRSHHSTILHSMIVAWAEMIEAIGIRRLELGDWN
jgi:hypothetical protein